MAPSSATATKRLLHELREHAQARRDGDADADGLVHLGPVSDEQMLLWEAVLRAPDSDAPDARSGYEGGQWKLSIRIPPSYPMAPPEVRFQTPICHPNVHFQTGEICLDLLKQAWSPAYGIARTLQSVRLLLADPAPESPLNVDVAALLRTGDAVGARALVGFYTAEFRWDDRTADRG
ncbi:MAG: hypothetical protein M1832_003932 [Thelocarpon impressellum]|nr:MAG: hypothetical protein M1832_003932 [Thelocarpon impressellum]